MSDGLWNTGRANEQINQARFIRHRGLTINLDGSGNLNPQDASGYGSIAPDNITAATVSARGREGGPHFVMSPETTDGRPTLGFQFCLSNYGLSFPVQPGEEPAGFNLTIWYLIENSQFPKGASTPVWAAMSPLTGVGFNELYSSFDINTGALRFQISNYIAEGADDSSITIWFAEL